MPENMPATDQDSNQPQQSEAAAPLFDMSKAQPIQTSQPTQPVENSKPLFDMSKATPIQATTPPARQGATGVAGVLSGIGGGVFDTVQGGKELLNKVLPNTMQIPDVPADLRSQDSTSEKVGGFLENVGEFALGDEALKGAAKGLGLLEKMPQSLRVIAEAHPKLTKALLGITSSATVGGAQGAVKGASEGDATGGAIGGGVGGAVGGAAGELIGPGLKTLGKVFGIGLDSEDALIRGVKPSVGEDANFRQALDTAAPRIVEAAQIKPPKTVAEFEDLLHNKAQDIRKNEFGPMIQRNAKQMVSAQPVAANIRSAITDQMREYAPDEATELEDFAVKFSKNMPLGKAESDLQYFNAQLKKFYKANAIDQTAALKTNGTVAKYEAAADGLRDLIYGRLKELGEDAPEELQKQYGALKTLERSVAKRATVSERQNPLNMTEVMSVLAGAGEMGGAVLSGHPFAAAAGVLPYAAAKAAKVLNSSDSLVKRGVQSMVKDASPVGVIQKIAPTVGSAIKTGTAALGSQAGQAALTDPSEEWVQVRDSKGQQWHVHPSDLAKMQQKDPGIQLVSSNLG